MIKVLAVASSGGHFIQLLRLTPSFKGTNLRFISTKSDLKNEVSEHLYVVTDANLTEKLKLFIMFLQTAWIIIKFRPDVVISTGAGPGFAAIFFGKIFRAKTIWVDSIANFQEMSVSGKYARRFSDLWLTQWEHLSTENGPEFRGSII